MDFCQGVLAIEQRNNRAVQSPGQDVRSVLAEQVHMHWFNDLDVEMRLDPRPFEPRPVILRLIAKVREHRRKLGFLQLVLRWIMWAHAHILPLRNDFGAGSSPAELAMVGTASPAAPL